MKIAILSRSKNIYSTRRLVEAAKEKGHEPNVVDTLRCYMNIASHRPTIHYRGEQGHFDLLQYKLVQVGGRLAIQVVKVPG